MLIEIILQHLKSHKRLVIPQLGALIVKEESGNVLLSEMLRRDDGVLRGLLCERGLNELEAAGEIDRFVFEIRHAVQDGLEYSIEGLGVMRQGPNGTILFRYEPRPAPAIPAEPAISDPAVSAEPAASSAAQPAYAESTPAAATSPVSAASTTSAKPSNRAAAGQTAPSSASTTQAPSSAAPHAPQYDSPKISVSPKISPEPYVKGLRYGKPQRTTDAYTYVSRAPRRRTDSFLWIALIAAALALAAIVVGYYRSMNDDEPTYIESTTMPAAPAVPTGGAPAQDSISTTPAHAPSGAPQTTHE